MRKRSIFVLAIALSLASASTAFAAWTGPTQAPPGGNVAAPINVGTTAQTKDGYLGVNETGTPVFPLEDNGDALVEGDLVLNVNGGAYINFDSAKGSNGYGIWDNAGKMYYKNSGDPVWSAFGGGGGQWVNGPSSSIYYNGGNVGVGSTLTPLSPLTVNNGLGLYGGSWSTVSFNTYYTSGGWINYNAGYPDVIQADQSNGGLGFYTGASVAAGAASNVNEAMSISPAGLVNMADSLDVTGNLCLNGSCITNWPTPGVGGSGSSGYLPRWTAASTLGNSSLSSDGVSTTANGNFFVTGALHSTGYNTDSWYPFTDGNTYIRMPASGGFLHVDSLPSDATVFAVNSSGTICLNGNCINNWPSSSDTLDTVTSRGATTANGIQVGGMTSTGNASVSGTLGVGNYIAVQNTLGINGNSIWTNNGTLYLSPSNGTVQANGTISAGAASVSGTLGVGNYIAVQNTLGINGNSIWTNNGTLYLSPSNGTVQANGTISAGAASVSGTLHTTGSNTDSWYPYTDGNTYVRIPSGGFFHVDKQGTGTLFSVDGNNAASTFNGALNINGNQVWTNTGDLYLNYGNNGTGGVQIGNQTSNGRLGTNGLSPDSGYPSNWAGGIHTFDIYAEGTIGVGGSGGNIQAWMSNSGAGWFSGAVSAGSFLYNSDERLKHDIQPLTGNLAKVLAIHPVTYYWDDPSRGTGLQIGFIAQNVQAVVPQIVHEDASTTLLSLDYARTTPLLFGAVQELDAKIEAQQTTIDTQQAEIDQLKAAVAALQAK